MPIVERDPWRMQYFENARCPDEVFVPTEDGDAYALYPQYRWLYNKLAVAESQDMDCGLHGMTPHSFPVFSKPVYNMRGMGAESRVFRSAKEYMLYQKPGHFWMPRLQGEHVSSDVAVVDGEPHWWRHVLGGTVFTAALVEGRPREEVARIRAEYLRLAAPYADGGLPVAALLASGEKRRMRARISGPRRSGCPTPSNAPRPAAKSSSPPAQTLVAARWSQVTAIGSSGLASAAAWPERAWVSSTPPPRARATGARCRKVASPSGRVAVSASRQAASTARTASS